MGFEGGWNDGVMVELGGSFGGQASGLGVDVIQWFFCSFLHQQTPIFNPFLIYCTQ